MHKSFEDAVDDHMRRLDLTLGGIAAGTLLALVGGFAWWRWG